MWWQFEVLQQKNTENRCSRTLKKNVNSVINFRRVTHFWLCLLETQVLMNESVNYRDDCRTAPATPGLLKHITVIRVCTSYFTLVDVIQLTIFSSLKACVKSDYQTFFGIWYIKFGFRDESKISYKKSSVWLLERVFSLKCISIIGFSFPKKTFHMI